METVNCLHILKILGLLATCVIADCNNETALTKAVTKKEKEQS